MLASCSNVQDHPYHLAATGQNCDYVVAHGEYPLLDPVQSFSACEDDKGTISYPNGAMPNGTIAGAQGLISAMIEQAAEIGSMTGGL